MNPLLAIDPEIILVAVMPIAVIVIGGIVALWRRNGNGQRHVEGVHENAIDPDSERTGEMSVAFWKRRFDSIDEKLDEILEAQREAEAGSVHQGGETEGGRRRAV